VSVRIRLRRMGAKKNPFYRIIVADSKKPRDGRYIDSIGTYDPLKEPSSIQIEEEKLFGWLKNGAQPSDPVWDLLSRLGLRQKWEMLRRGEDLSGWQPPAPRTPRERKAQVAEEKDTAGKVKAEKPAAPPPEESIEAKAEETPVKSESPETAKAKEDKKEDHKKDKAATGQKTAEPKAKGKQAAGKDDKKEEVKAENKSKKEDVEKDNAENA